MTNGQELNYAAGLQYNNSLSQQMLCYGMVEEWALLSQIISNYPRLKCLSFIGNMQFEVTNSEAMVTLKQMENHKAFSYNAPGYQYLATSFDDTLPAKLSELTPLIGSYCSDELESQIHIYQQDGALFYRYPQSLPVKIYPAQTSNNITWNSKNKVWVGHAMFQFSNNRNKAAKVLKIGDFRVSGVTFELCNNVNGAKHG